MRMKGFVGGSSRAMLREIPRDVEALSMCEHHQVSDKPRIVSLEGMHRRDIVRGLWAGTLVLAVPATAGCESAAEFFAPSDADLAPMAAQAWEQTKRETPISRDARANARLQAVGPKIASVANVPNAQWEFVVFDSQEKNAFVLPGGKVGFYKGLMDFTENDDQVAAVLGHEVGHVVRRHAALRAGQQQATALGLALGGALAGGVLENEGQKDAAMAILGAGATVGILLPFSRGNELEADKLGVDYMHATGYDVKQSIRLWELMGAASSSRPTEWMSTHPNPETRISELRAYINTRGYARV
jgi:predicted Zn-dependent protease